MFSTRNGLSFGGFLMILMAQEEHNNVTNSKTNEEYRSIVRR
jgi:hypothetical protein